MFLINHLIARQEKNLGVSLQYLRDIAANSNSALLKLGFLGPIGSHRKHLPKEAWHLARLAATRVEGCGDCVQIVINLAIKDGISRELLQAALSTDLDLLPMDLALAMRFAETIARHSDNEYLRNRLIKVYGRPAFDELALVIASCRVLPALKRALGHSQNCALVQIPSAPEEVAA